MYINIALYALAFPIHYVFYIEICIACDIESVSVTVYIFGCYAF
jgi:hypothetical protein